MKIAAIIQARTGSTRLPNKIFKSLAGKPLITHVIDRLRYSKYLNDIIIATTIAKNDDNIEKWANENGVTVFRGAEDNVLERYCLAARHFDVDIIARITSDDPFKDYRILDKAIEKLIDGKYDFVCNNNPVSFPEGLDVEVLTRAALENSYTNTESDFEREHVTQYIHKNPDNFKIFNIRNLKNLSSHRWTIDTKDDYIFVSEVYNRLYKEGELFLPEDIYDLLDTDSTLLEINKDVKKSDLYR